MLYFSAIGQGTVTVMYLTTDDEQNFIFDNMNLK